MKVGTLLELGRTSNLPTVWSNVLCGAVLSGADLRLSPLLLMGTVGSLFYLGGMFLNDAFDAPFDARERPERPIPSGRASRGSVLGLGILLLLVGLLGLTWAGASGLSASGYGALISGLGTVVLILIYDRWHKGYALAPWVMGGCRAGLIVTSALLVAEQASAPVLLGALALLGYVAGLTHVASFETGTALRRLGPTFLVLGPSVLALWWLLSGRAPVGAVLVALIVELGWVARAIGLAIQGGPGRIGQAVVGLIGGIALVDAVLIAASGQPLLALLSAGFFVLASVLSRRIRAT